jgi:chorismate dehydratase
MTFTLGIVPYLNALPLYHTLHEDGTGQDGAAQSPQSSAANVKLVRAVPSQLAPMLSRGECDVALIPIVEHFRGVGERIVSDACIGSSGVVRSVLLFSRLAPQDIRRVAIDASSRTSVALLRVVLRDGYGVAPEFVEHAPDRCAMLKHADAALLIGDNALEAAAAPEDDRERDNSERDAENNPITILDLGEEWTRLTGLPFVYAAWVARHHLSDEAARELAALLDTARDAGRELLTEIARANSNPQLSSALIESYLRDAINHHMTASHRAGLEEFRRRCAAHQLL